MKKILFICLFVFYSISVFANKPSLFILDDKSIVIIQDNLENITADELERANTIKNNLQTRVEAHNIAVWYSKKDLYDKITFNDKSILPLSNIKYDDTIILYSKGKPYYMVRLSDFDLEKKINSYFEKEVYVSFQPRYRTAYETSYEGVIYINFDEKELYELENTQLDENEYKLYMEYIQNSKLVLRNNLNTLKIPYKETNEKIKYIVFPNGQKISLENSGGNIIYFKQGKASKVHPVSDFNSLEKLQEYFK